MRRLSRRCDIDGGVTTGDDGVRHRLGGRRRSRKGLFRRRVAALHADDDTGESEGERRRGTRNNVVGPSPSELGLDRTGGGSLFCFGLGYTSLGLVSTLRRAGWQVAGTCRSEERVASFAAAGVEAHLWRPDDGVGLSSEGMRALMNATHVLSSVPPVGDFDRDPVLADAACVDALVASAAAASPGRFPANTTTTTTTTRTLRWVGYLSSTGVYGDKGGSWVDENTVPVPVSPKGIARYAAEEAWRELFDLHGVPVEVFRLGGIYGPGRSILDTVLAKNAAATRSRASRVTGGGAVGTGSGTGTNGDGGGGGGGGGTESRSQRARGSRKFTSRCHVGDVVAVLCASMSRRAAEEQGDDDDNNGLAAATATTMRVYNVVDDEPAPRADAAAYARKLLNIEGDDVDGDVAGDVAGGGAEGSARGEKRVRNDKIKDELGVQLLYPTYREGLSAIAAGDMTPFE